MQSVKLGFKVMVRYRLPTGKETTKAVSRLFHVRSAADEGVRLMKKYGMELPKDATEIDYSTSEVFGTDDAFG